MRNKENTLIQLVGSIDEENFKEFSQTLNTLECGTKVNEITLELSSEGGTTYDALAFSSRMIHSDIDINVIGYGLIASAAVLVLASGAKRYMDKEAWVMVHEDEGDLEGNVVALEREAAQLRRLESQWCRLLEELTGTPAEIWSKLHKETTYLTADDCLKLGLIDEVI